MSSCKVCELSMTTGTRGLLLSQSLVVQFDHPQIYTANLKLMLRSAIRMFIAIFKQQSVWNINGTLQLDVTLRLLWESQQPTQKLLISNLGARSMQDTCK